MAKKSEKKDRKKTLALILVEGDTEVDFYRPAWGQARPREESRGLRGSPFWGFL